MDHGPPGQNDLPHEARFYYKGLIFLGLVTLNFFPQFPLLENWSLAVPECCRGLSPIRRTVALPSSSGQEGFHFWKDSGAGHPGLAWALAVPAQCPGLSQKQIFRRFTHCPRGGDSRTCCPHGQRARVQVSWQSPAYSSAAPCSLSVPANSPCLPLFLSSFQMSQSDSPFPSCFLRLLFRTHLPPPRNIATRG